MKLAFLYDSRFTQPELLTAFKNFTQTTKPVKGCQILLRWGNPDGPDDNAAIVLNRKEPLKNCLDKENLFRILGLNRIRRPRIVMPRPDSRYPMIGKKFDFAVNLQQEKPVSDFRQAGSSGADFFVEYIDAVKKYNVYFFDLNCLLLTKKIPVKTNSKVHRADLLWEYEEIPADLDMDTRKVCLLAQRAMHVLGLDFGAVHTCIDARGRATVLDVTPVPFLPPKALSLFRQAIQKHCSIPAESNRQPLSARHGFVQTELFSEQASNEITKKEDVLLGADPEFMLRDTLSGRMVYASEYMDREGLIGYDERSEHREGRFFPLAEVRPAPDFCPLKLTEKIRDGLKEAQKIIPPHIEWLAGSLHFDRYQIGGHIHFSNVPLCSRLLRALDNYLAIPVMLAEDPATSARRRKQYGWLGSIRLKPHGGFEYRTPGSWLISPELTSGCLCLAKIVAANYMALPRDCFTDVEMQKAFYLAKKSYFYDIFNELWEDITLTPQHSKYAPHMASLVNLIKTRSHWNEKTDLRKSWGLPGQD